MPICPMCEKAVPEFHKKSHVIPEWMHDDCYDEKNRLIQVSLVKEHAGVKQSGIYGQFWCPGCETQSNDPDRYVSHVFSNKAPASKAAKAITRKKHDVSRDGRSLSYEHWQGIDFRALQRFVFITIIRAHLNKLQREGSGLLPEKHFEQMREIYLSDGELDDQSYPILVYQHPPDDPQREMVTLPYVTKLDGHHRVAFKAGGFMFYTWISSHTPGDHVMGARMLKTGELYTPFVSYSETGEFKNSVESLQSVFKKYPAERFDPKKK